VARSRKSQFLQGGPSKLRLGGDVLDSNSHSRWKPEHVPLPPLLPISRLSAGVSNRHDLDLSLRLFPVNQGKRKLSEQEPASLVWAGNPTLRRLTDLLKPAIHFRIELKGGLGTTLQVPIKRCILFRGCFLVELHGLTGRWAPSLSCACVPLTTKWSSSGRSRVL
jgi:hypothetical protein